MEWEVVIAALIGGGLGGIGPTYLTYRYQQRTTKELANRQHRLDDVVLLEDFLTEIELAVRDIAQEQGTIRNLTKLEELAARIYARYPRDSPIGREVLGVPTNLDSAMTILQRSAERESLFQAASEGEGSNSEQSAFAGELGTVELFKQVVRFELEDLRSGLGFSPRSGFWGSSMNDRGTRGTPHSERTSDE